MKALEKAIAQLDGQKRALIAQSLEPVLAAEALRIDNELAAVVGRLGPAEERWLELQAELDEAG